MEPVRIGSKIARNRVMRLPTVPMLLDDSRIGPRLLAFYASLAAGGVGTIVTESFTVKPGDGVALGAIIASNGAGPLLASDPANVPGMRQLAGVAHEAGALVIASLYHGGRQHLGRSAPTMIAPSAIACPQSGGIPHAMTVEEVEAMVTAFAAAAGHCMQAGFDGVEIHGAQGHLVQQFVSGFSNRRDDRYGGTAEKRTRFARDILTATRARIGREAVLGYRMAVDEFTEGGITAEDSESFAGELARERSVDYLSLSQGNFNTNDTHIPDRTYEPASFRSLHARIKRAARALPVVACGRIETPDLAEAIIASGDADLIGLARPLVADPDWPAKWAAGKPETIRLCIVCNKCWDMISEGRPIRCSVNATVGREAELGPLELAAHPRTVIVAGGGPAGLEAARVAALRGHRVTLLERKAVFGGKIVSAALGPTHGELARVMAFLVPAAHAAGVTFRTGVDATADLILASQPDAVILATGSTVTLPDLRSDGSVPLLPFKGAVDPAPLTGDTVVVMDEDGYAWGAAAVQAAVQTGKSVVLVTRFFEVLRELPSVSRMSTLRALDRAGVILMPNTSVIGIEDGSVLLSNYRSDVVRRIPRAAAVFWVGLQRAETDLASALAQQGSHAVQLIGDAYAPRRLLSAIEEGHLAGRRI